MPCTMKYTTSWSTHKGQVIAVALLCSSSSGHSIPGRFPVKTAESPHYVCSFPLQACTVPWSDAWLVHGLRDPYEPAMLTELTCSDDTVASAAYAVHCPMICTACPSSQHLSWEALNLLAPHLQDCTVP